MKLIAKKKNSKSDISLQYISAATSNPLAMSRIVAGLVFTLKSEQLSCGFLAIELFIFLAKMYKALTESSSI